MRKPKVKRGVTPQERLAGLAEAPAVQRLVTELRARDPRSRMTAPWLVLRTGRRCYVLCHVSRMWVGSWPDTEAGGHAAVDALIEHLARVTAQRKRG